MTVVFDLDYTLLDTEAFKVALCSTLGITVSEFNDHSKLLFSGPPKRHYDLRDHIHYLVNSDEDRAQELLEKCNTEVQSRMNEFLFPESRQVVDRFLDAGWEVHLMTLGSPEFQEWKVAGLDSINSKFSKKIYVGTKKVEFLADYAHSDEPVLFVNDNARESVEILQSLPELRLALIDGGYSKNIDHDLEVFKLAQIDPSQFSSIDISQ